MFATLGLWDLLAPKLAKRDAPAMLHQRNASMSASRLFHSVGFEPTAEQLAIQCCARRQVVAMANAGAAKTTTLALRVAESLKRGIKPEAMLVLTFSGEAADVFRQTLKQVGADWRDIKRIRIQTFYQFSIDELDRIERNATRVLISLEEVAPHVRAAVALIQTRNANSTNPRVLFLPEHNAQIDEFLQLSRRLKANFQRIDNPEESIDELAERLGLAPELLRLMRAIELARTGDDPWRTTEDSVNDLVEAVGNGNRLPSYRVVVVDELQDLNRAAYRLLEYLVRPFERESNRACYFTGAGDFDQVIHGWAGSSVDFIKTEFGLGWPDLLRLPLSHVFRHGPQMAAAVASQKSKSVSSLRNAPAVIQEIEYKRGDHSNVGGAVLDAIKTWREMDRSMTNLAIILRAPHQSISIENALLRAGYATECVGFESYMWRPEILVLRSVIAYARDDFESIADPSMRLAALDALLLWQELRWSRARRSDVLFAAQDRGTWREFFEGVLLTPRTTKDNADALLSEEQVRYRDSQVLNRVASLRKQGNTAEAERIMSEWNEAAATIAETHTERAARLRLESAIRRLQRLDSSHSAAGALDLVVRELDLPAVARRLFISASNAHIATRSLMGFVGMARESGLGIDDFSSMFKKLEVRHLNAKQTYVNDQRKVRLCTVDAAKGREFDCVIIPYLEVGEFPLSQADQREESNRFYVAITRMRDKLVLITEQSQPHPYVQAMRISKSKTAGKGARDNLSGP